MKNWEDALMGYDTAEPVDQAALAAEREASLAYAAEHGYDVDASGRYLPPAGE